MTRAPGSGELGTPGPAGVSADAGAGIGKGMGGWTLGCGLIVIADIVAFRDNPHQAGLAAIQEIE